MRQVVSERATTFVHLTHPTNVTRRRSRGRAVPVSGARTASTDIFTCERTANRSATSSRSPGERCSSQQTVAGAEGSGRSDRELEQSEQQ